MITPENLIYLAAGVLAVAVLARLLAPPRPEPPTPVVTARVVPPAPAPDPIAPIALIAGQLHQAIEAQGMALALSRKANQMIEAKAASVDFPWIAAPAAPPAPEPPKG